MFTWFSNPMVSTSAKVVEALWMILQAVLAIVLVGSVLVAAFAVFVVVPDCLFGMVGHFVCNPN